MQAGMIALFMMACPVGWYPLSLPQGVHRNLPPLSTSVPLRDEDDIQTQWCIKK